MPLKKEKGKAIRGYVKANSKQRVDCQAVINKLSFADLGRGGGSAKKGLTMHEKGVARLDMQGTTSDGGKNIQCQIGDSTAAAVIVSKSVLAEKDGANQRGIAKAAVSALQQSLDTGYVFNVTGSIP